MKKNSLIIVAVLFLTTTFVSFGQSETNTNANDVPQKAISYSFINEYGTFLGGAFGFTGVFVNGIKFNKTQDMIGIGIGYEFDSESEQSLPIFVNYRHYFPGKRALKPLVNIGAGLRISFWDEWIHWNEPYYDEYGNYYCDHWYGYSESKIAPGLYLTMAAGFKVKALSFTSGFFMKSCGAKNFFGGVEMKVGFTF
jgi:hypothetical protein